MKVFEELLPNIASNGLRCKEEDMAFKKDSVASEITWVIIFYAKLELELTSKMAKLLTLVPLKKVRKFN